VRLAKKDLGLASALAHEFDVPVRMANMALQEMTEAISHGWEGLDSRGAMMLQSQRANVEIKLSREELEGLLDD
jgi:3-hydroxyisobutyrate dehydrogenase